MQNTFIMPTLQIRDLPQEIYDSLKIVAEESRRSMTQEVIHILDKYLTENQEINEYRKNKKEAIERLKELRKEIKVKLTKEEIVDMIREDRDR